MEVGKHEEQPFLVPSGPVFSEPVSEEDQVDAQETPFREYPRLAAHPMLYSQSCCY